MNVPNLGHLNHMTDFDETFCEKVKAFKGPTYQFFNILQSVLDAQTCEMGAMAPILGS